MDTPFVTATGNPTLGNVGPLAGGIGVLNPTPASTNAKANAGVSPAQLAAVGAKTQAQYDQIVAQSKATNAAANQSTTTLTSNKGPDIANIKDKTNTLASGGVTSDSTTGNATLANGSAYSPPPTVTGAIKNPDGSTTTTYSDGTAKQTAAVDGTTPTGGYNGDTYIAPGSPIPKDPNGNAVTLTDNPPSVQANLDAYHSLMTQADALTASLIANTKASYERLIQQQQQANTASQGSLTSFLLKSGSLQGTASGTAALNSRITYGLQQIGDLQNKENAAIIAAQQAGLTQDFQLMDKINTQIESIRKEKQDAIQKQNDTILKAQQDLATEQYNQQKDTTDSINQLATDAAKNGASADVLKAISGAKTVQDAINAAGGSLQTASGQLGDYLQYKRDTSAKGLTPLDYDTWKAQDDARQAKLKSSEAYSTAYSSAAGKAAAEAQYGIGTDTPSGVPTPGATGITQATGLPLVVFNYLTQGTSALTRMSASQRQQVMNQANDFLNKNGLDVSTFQSQFKAQNDVLQKGIERAANTKIFAGEVSGTVDQFIKDAGNDFGSLKAANVVKLLAGKQFNDPTVQKYAFNLQTMQNDLAGYFAAARGATSPDDSDKADAATVITNGINSKSADAFKQSITANEEKVGGVVQNAVNSAQKSVWDLFGVGASYKPSAPQINPKDAVNNYVKANPTKADSIAKLYEVPGATDQDILDYINQLQK